MLRLTAGVHKWLRAESQLGFQVGMYFGSTYGPTSHTILPPSP